MAIKISMNDAKTRITTLSECISYSSEYWKRSDLFSPEAAGAGLSPGQLLWRELVEGQIILTWQQSLLCEHLSLSLVIFPTIPLCSLLLPTGSCSICTEMHLHTHTKKAICYKMNHWSNISEFNLLPL